MRPNLILVAVLGAIAGAVTAFFVFGIPQIDDAKRSQKVVGMAQLGGPFTLVDHTGKTVTDKDFHGKKMLIYFGFTHCPDICPGSLQVISNALEQLGDKANGVTPVFITVDPERDTPEQLASYVTSFHPRFVGLTGDPETVNTVVKKTFRIYAKKVSDKDQPNSYTIDHASLIYLMDEKGQFEKFFPHPTSADKLAEQLAPYL